MNKPFAHFQTVVLNDETSLEEIESVPTPDLDTAPSTDDTPDDNPTTSDLPPAETDALPPEFPVQEADEEMPQDEPTDKGVTDTPQTASTPQPETEADDNANSDEPEEMPQQQPDDHVAGSADNDQDSVSETPDVQQSPNEDGAANPETQPQDSEEEESPTPPLPDQTEVPDTRSHEVKTETEEADNTSGTSQSMRRVNYVIKDNPARRLTNRWRLAALFLFAILLMGASYFAGYYKVFCPPCETTPLPTPQQPIPAVGRTDTIGKTPTDTTVKPQPADAQKPVLPANTPEVKPEAQKTEAAAAADTTKKPLVRIHTVRKGENLSSIARKYYGNKKYAAFIIAHNKLANPDIIPVGTRLKLPQKPGADKAQ